MFEEVVKAHILCNLVMFGGGGHNPPPEDATRWAPKSFAATSGWTPPSLPHPPLCLLGPKTRPHVSKKGCPISRSRCNPPFGFGGRRGRGWRPGNGLGGEAVLREGEEGLRGGVGVGGGGRELLKVGGVLRRTQPRK